MNTSKPFAPSAEQNKQAILDALKSLLYGVNSVFEIGSGTGQHAVFFAEKIPSLQWQCSDLAQALPGMKQWIADSGLGNLAEPKAFNVQELPWPMHELEFVYTSNTLHIMSAAAVVKTFEGLGQSLKKNGCFCCYGPFIFDGQHISDSNAEFDQMLRARDPQSGLREVTDLQQVANAHGLVLQQTIKMPVNNHVLVWGKI